MKKSRQRKIFEEMILAPIVQGQLRLKVEKLTAFLSRKGSLYNNQLMVVGRAVNGWDEGLLPIEFADKKKANSYVDEIFAASFGDNNDCPLAWIGRSWGVSVPNDPYRASRSAFWRVIKSLSLALNITHGDDQNWFSYLVWSNLSKLASADGGNPGGLLLNLQLPGCIALLKQEIEDYRPQRIVFLTGDEWVAPYLAAMGFTSVIGLKPNFARSAGRLTTRTGRIVDAVVAVHPQGKNQQIWTEEVMNAFGLIK